MALVQRRPKGSWDLKQSASVKHVACITLSYQKLFRQDVGAFLQRCTEEVIYFPSLLFFFHLEQEEEIHVLLIIRTVYLNELVTAFGNRLVF